MDSIATFLPFHPKTPPPGGKNLEQFKLGLGSFWESSDREEDDSEKEIDSLLIIVLLQYEVNK